MLFIDESVSDLTRSGSRTYKIYFYTIMINSEFYMTISDNKVTKVYDYKIITVGPSYSNAQLSKTSTTGKLDFDTSYALLHVSCWLKGEVSGTDNGVITSVNY